MALMMQQEYQALRMNPAKAKEYFENEMAFTTGPVELERMLNRGDVNIVDVREEEDFRNGHIPGAVCLPKSKWDEASQYLSREKINVLYCYSIVCHLAKTAAVEFSAKGFPVMELDGGFKTWKEHEMEIER